MKKIPFLILPLLTILCASQLNAQTELHPEKMTFPYSIDTPGHYILKNNITITSEDTIFAIEINSPGVTLDLNGYTITGPLTCNQSTCNYTYATTGVLSQYADDNILNGRITGFYTCLQTYASGTIQNITATGCLIGIEAGSNSIIRGNNVNNCTGYGIYGIQSVITENNVWNNEYGILADTSNTTKNEIYNNTYEGLSVYNGGLVANNVVYGNAIDEQPDGSKIVFVSNACTSGPC